MLDRIVSGGQTGVDRAALDAALAVGLARGGWCPLGRRAEDGPIPLHYPLVETTSANYAQRTRANVRDSDATLIVCRGEPGGGSAFTALYARRLGRPLRVVDLDGPAPPPGDTSRWCAAVGAATLNVAGPRASSCPGVYARAYGYLLSVFLAAAGGEISRSRSPS